MNELIQITGSGRIDTGWTCCIVGCNQVARVDDGQGKMCETHADMWQHGSGKSLTDIEKELANNE